MTPRRLIRWKSFWFGILVLAFLLFCWGRSSIWREVASFDIRRDQWIVRSHYGFLETICLKNYAYGSTGFWSQPVGGFKIEIPPAFQYSIKKSQKGPVYEWRVAHWFLILLFLIPWAALFAWRWRRQRILTKAHDAAPAH